MNRKPKKFRRGRKRKASIADKIAFVLAAVVLFAIGIFKVAQTPSTEELLSNAPTEVAGALQSLPITDEAVKKTQENIPRYKRDKFGARWADVNHTGCDTRNEILARDMTQVIYKPGTHDCVVLSGSLDDPYTGETILFERGQGTSEKVQIDHVVALKDAWVSGAWRWEDSQRLEFANDPLNLLAVDGSANQEKSDLSADGWLPANKSYLCDFAVRQVAVKKKWELSVTQDEKRALADVLSKCQNKTY